MERERVAENQRIGNRRRRQIDPDDGAGGRVQPAAIDAGGPLRTAVAMDEYADQL
jgi:hypothetical protein